MTIMTEVFTYNIFTHNVIHWDTLKKMYFRKIILLAGFENKPLKYRLVPNISYFLCELN